MPSSCLTSLPDHTGIMLVPGAPWTLGALLAAQCRSSHSAPGSWYIPSHPTPSWPIGVLPTLCALLAVWCPPSCSSVRYSSNHSMSSWLTMSSWQLDAFLATRLTPGCLEPLAGWRISDSSVAPSCWCHSGHSPSYYIWSTRAAWLLAISWTLVPS